MHFNRASIQWKLKISYLGARSCSSAAVKAYPLISKLWCSAKEAADLGNVRDLQQTRTKIVDSYYHIFNTLCGLWNLNYLKGRVCHLRKSNVCKHTYFVSFPYKIFSTCSFSPGGRWLFKTLSTLSIWSCAAISRSNVRTNRCRNTIEYRLLPDDSNAEG